MSRLEIVETGRRRRWSDSEKLRIVEESYSAPLAVKRIDLLFDIERDINGLSADERLRVRQERSAPLLAELRHG